MTAEQCEAWAWEFDSWDICDEATTSLFVLSAHGWSKSVHWAKRDREWVKRGAFTPTAGLAVHDKTAKDADFKALFLLIIEFAWDERNFVKKAVNWALRNIGKRNLALNRAAIDCASKLLDAANRRAGGERGGHADTRAARWIATDALRELKCRRLPNYPLPVLRLARLGVDTRAQGHGVGSALLRHVLHLSLEQRERFGCVGIVTDAKADAVAFYEALGFVALEGVCEGLLVGEPQPMFLGLKTIAATAKR